jgi:hypothetical protein
LPDSWLGGSGSVRFAEGRFPALLDEALLAALGVRFSEVCPSVVWSGSLVAACEACTWARAELARDAPDPQPMARMATPHRHPAPATALRNLIERC